METKTLAEQKFINEIKDIDSFTGADISSLIDTIDRLQKYYFVTELQKRELETAIKDYLEGSVGAGIDNLLQTANQIAGMDDLTVSAIDNQIFDISEVRKFLNAVQNFYIRSEEGKPRTANYID